jgi:hypothetical protein
MSDCKDCPKTDIQLLSCNNHTQMQQQQPVMENKPVPFEQNPQPMQPIQPMQSQPDQLPVPSEQKRTSSSLSEEKKVEDGQRVSSTVVSRSIASSPVVLTNPCEGVYLCIISDQGVPAAQAKRMKDMFRSEWADYNQYIVSHWDGLQSAWATNPTALGAFQKGATAYYQYCLQRIMQSMDIKRTRFIVFTFQPIRSKTQQSQQYQVKYSMIVQTPDVTIERHDMGHVKDVHRVKGSTMNLSSANSSAGTTTDPISMSHVRSALNKLLNKPTEFIYQTRSAGSASRKKKTLKSENPMQFYLINCDQRGRGTADLHPLHLCTSSISTTCSSSVASTEQKTAEQHAHHMSQREQQQRSPLLELSSPFVTDLVESICQNEHRKATTTVTNNNSKQRNNSKNSQKQRTRNKHRDNKFAIVWESGLQVPAATVTRLLTAVNKQSAESAMLSTSSSATTTKATFLSL